MGKLAVKIVTDTGFSQPVAKLGKCDLVVADANSSQPIPMTTAEFEASQSGAQAEASFLELEAGGLIELEDSSGFLELEA